MPAPLLSEYPDDFDTTGSNLVAEEGEAVGMTRGLSTSSEFESWFEQQNEERIGAQIERWKDQSTKRDQSKSFLSYEYRPLQMTKGYLTLQQLWHPPKKTRRPRARTIALQEWEGHVTEVGESEFSSALIDVTQPNSSDAEIAVFDLDEVSPNDVPLIKEGAVFNWIIGYRVTETGQKQSVSYLVFRRLPSFRQTDMDRSSDELDQLFEFLSDEE